MKPETKDAWTFYGMMAIVIIFTILSFIGWGIASTVRLIKRIFGWKEKTI